MKHIKDPLHGYIDVPKPELTIINTPTYQRLRRIKQLGMSETVYPSASHTRFAHSLGVMHLARKLGKSIGLSDNQVRENQVAGLLHDLGHLPFSHTFEDLFESRLGYSHEEISCDYVNQLKSNEEVNFPVDHEAVKDIIMGNYDGTNLISNEIDCDRLDYLLRDSYHTGIQLGRIEHDTLIKFAERINGDLGFDHKSLRSVERLLDARMQMNYSVYSHDTVNITETMLERSVELHVDNTSDRMVKFVGLDDSEMNYLLLNSNYDPAGELYSFVRDRKLYKTAYYNPLEDYDIEDLEQIHRNLSDNVQQHEEEIADMAGVERHKVLISSVDYKDIPKYTTPIRTPMDDIRDFEDMSPKPRALRENMRIDQNIHIFCHPNCVEQVSDASKSYLKSLDILDS